MRAAPSDRPAADPLGDMIEWCPYRSLLGYGLTEAAIMSRRPAAAIAAPDMAPGDPSPALLAELAGVLRSGEVVLILARDRAYRDRLKALLLALAGAVPEGHA
jgi:hypothetical protein